MEGVPLHLPAIAPGFRATDADHAEVRDTIARLFNGPKARAKFVADEKEIGAAFRSLNGWPRRFPISKAIDRRSAYSTSLSIATIFRPSAQSLL